MHHRRTFARLWMALVAGIAVAFVVPARAQDEEEPAPKPKAKAAAKAKSSPVRKGPGKPGARREAPPEYVPPNEPAVDAVLATKPATPSDWIHVAQILSQLRRPDLAKGFLQKVLLAKLNDEQLCALVDQYSANAFTEMASHEELLPEAEQLAEAALSAINRRVQDPKRIAEAIKQLEDPSEEARLKALSILRDARGAAVGALIDVLADPQRAAEHRAARAALVQMRQDAVGPLVGILEHCEPKLMVQAMVALAEMNARDAAVYLLGPASADKADPKIRAAAQLALSRLTGKVPDKRTAAETLFQQAKNYYQQKQVLKTDNAGRVQQWSWDTAARRCVGRSRSMEDAARVLAARLARDAYALTPEDSQVRNLYLATMLEEAVYENGLDKSLDLEKDAAARETARFGSKVVQEVLEYAMASQRPAAATAAAQILGRFGKADEVLRQGAQPSPLARALRHPDRRLRLAAAEAIVRLQPNAPFSGSSGVPEALAFFAASSGLRRALVAGPNVEASRELVGMLSQMRLQVDTAMSGRQAFRMATASPDYQVILIDAGITDPGVAQLVQDLRRDYRTASQRIGILARSGYMELAEHVARGDPMTRAFARPHLQEAFQWQMNELAKLGAREFMGFEERQQQAARALACLASLAQSSKGMYEIRRVQEDVLAALYSRGLTKRVVPVLANLGTPESQQALVDLCSRFTQPLEVRQAAAKAFLLSTKKYGILLTTESINRQYDRYDESKAQDPDSQQVLSTILDAIEEPTEGKRPTKILRPTKPAAPEQPAPKQPAGKTPAAKTVPKGAAAK